MDANRNSNNGEFSDFRLSLDRTGNRIFSVLTQVDNLESSSVIRHDSEPDWGKISAGVAILRHPETHAGQSLEFLGEALGGAAFGPAMLAVIARHLDVSHVRIWLKLSGDLASLPWEVCSFSKTQNSIQGTLSMHPGLSLIREVGSINLAAAKKRGRNRVLVVWADPSSSRYPHLPGIQKEVRSVMRALNSHDCRRFDVDELRYATPSALGKAIQSFRPDILHFIGHGDTMPTGGVLVLESGTPNVEVLLHSDELAKILGKTDIQLVVLSGCMTGESIGGVGPELGLSGIPAIVAMQAPLHDASAGLFARALYGSLAMGESVDDSVLEGRTAIRGTGNDWAVPVLMRTPFDGPSFDQEYEFEFVAEPPARRHNLLHDERPFIGRNVERLEIRDRISVKRQRLVTITGMGGMGKTRLGKQASAELLDDFPDGVWMIECDTLDGRDQLIGAVASVLGVAETGSNIEAAVIKATASKRLLLFFDCFEKIVDQADVLANLLRGCPDCHILVTSRIVLGISSEYEYRLSPMNLKKRGGEQGDGISLFVEAASHAVNSLEMTAKNRALVKELCQELEGVPLAIVLAAGRLRHLSLAELVEQVRLHPLEVLKRRGGPKDRQADLYRVVASSFLLLGDRECALLDKLGLFVGGFFAEDAAAVCNSTKTDLLPGLSTLRDHSLLQVQLVQDRTRYKLLDTVREFLEQLPRDDQEFEERRACAVRHADRYSRAAEQIGERILEGRWSDAANLLWADIGNFRGACNFAAEFELHAVLGRLARGLTRAYYEMALHQDFEQLMHAGLIAAAALNDPTLEASLLGLGGAAAAVKGDEEGWRSMWTKRFAICESIGDLNGSTDALFDLCWECVVVGKIDEAQEYLKKATLSSREANNHGLLASCFAVMAQIAMRGGNERDVRLFVEQATGELSLCNDIGQVIYVSQHLTKLNEFLGDMENARNACVTMLKLAFETHRYRNTAWGLLKLAELHENSGEPDLATSCYLAAVKLQAEFATRQGEKSRTLFNQFLKRHEQMEPLAQEHKRTPWRTLIKSLPYVQEPVSSS